MTEFNKFWHSQAAVSRGVRRVKPFWKRLDRRIMRQQGKRLLDNAPVRREFWM